MVGTVKFSKRISRFISQRILAGGRSYIYLVPSLVSPWKDKTGDCGPSLRKRKVTEVS